MSESSFLSFLFFAAIAIGITFFGRRKVPAVSLEDWGPPMEGLSARRAFLPSAGTIANRWAVDRRQNGLQVTASVRTRDHSTDSHGSGGNTIVSIPVADFQVNVGLPLPWFTFEARRDGIDPLTEPSALIRELHLPPGYGVAAEDHHAVLTLLQHHAVHDPMGQLLHACRDFDHVLIGARGNTLLCRELTPVPPQPAAEPLLMAMAALGSALRLAIESQQEGSSASTAELPHTPQESPAATAAAEAAVAPAATVADDAPPPLPPELEA